MKAKDLLTIWDAPDNSRLTSKQFTVRLPIRVAAQIAALNELYPRKSKTEIIGDLLATALDEVVANLPTWNYGPGPVDLTSTGEEIWHQQGPGVEFPQLVKKYLQELEKEEGHPVGTEPVVQTAIKQKRKATPRKTKT